MHVLSGGKLELVRSSGFNFNRLMQLASYFIKLYIDTYYNCIKSGIIIESEKHITAS